MRRIRIKICCIQSAAEARLAIGAGADALGLVGAMPSGPGPIEDREIAEIPEVVPPLLVIRSEGPVPAGVREPQERPSVRVDEVPSGPGDADRAMLVEGRCTSWSARANIDGDVVE